MLKLPPKWFVVGDGLSLSLLEDEYNVDREQDCERARSV
jgi:hypothetical protein